MHPLVARIHPSYRTAIISWFFARAICWMAHASTGMLALPLLYSPAYARGAPLWAGWVRACRSLEEYALWDLGGAGTVAMVVAGELALLVAATAVYRFARRQELPQTSERATWLWMLTPAMALTAPVSSWTFAAAGVAVGLAAVRSNAFYLGALALGVAVGFRVEAILVWPGFVWTAYRAYRPAKDSSFGAWLTFFAPLSAFTAVVGAAALFAGTWGMSIRGLHPATEWRTDFVWRGLGAEAPVLILATIAVLVVVLLVRSAPRNAGRALVAAAPPLVWPLLHEPVFEASGTLLFAVPAFVVLSRNMDDRSFERPAMVASAVALLLLCM